MNVSSSRQEDLRFMVSFVSFDLIYLFSLVLYRDLCYMKYYVLWQLLWCGVMVWCYGLQGLFNNPSIVEQLTNICDEQDIGSRQIDMKY